MAERVRIEFYEAEDVCEIVREFQERRSGPWRMPKADAEDLVNRIGEIYERALARQIVRAVREMTP
jgi:hypothetical protein